MKVKQLIKTKIDYLKGELQKLEKTLEKVEKGIIPNDNTIRKCPNCGNKSLHYYVDSNNWFCSCC
jgi:ssDNA-binding Zn-finger/Zn-ribbon topoisomerase 1